MSIVYAAQDYVGSTNKGLIVGVAAGVFARKVNSESLGVLFGLAVGFLLAFFVEPDGVRTSRYS
jgi:hypothetical protein